MSVSSNMGSSSYAEQRLSPAWISVGGLCQLSISRKEPTVRQQQTAERQEEQDCFLGQGRAAGPDVGVQRQPEPKQARHRPKGEPSPPVAPPVRCRRRQEQEHRETQQ